MSLPEAIGYCEAIASGTQEGKVNPLDSLAQLRAIMGAAQDALKVVDPLAIEEANKYPKTFEHGGVSFTRKEGARAFKYDHIPEVVDAASILKELQERAKNAALQLEKGLRVSTDDGELYTPAQIMYGKPSLTIGKA